MTHDVTLSNDRMMLSNRTGAGMLDRALALGAIAALLLTAASFVGSSLWLFELLTHFRLQFAVASTVLLLAALARRRPPIAIVAAIAAATNVTPLLPYVMTGPGVAEASQFQVRLLAANVSLRNSDYARLRQVIRDENPDIFGLLEVDQTWIDEMSPLRPDYPFTVLRPQEGAYGLALFSRVPVRELAASPYIEGGLQTAISVVLELEQTPITLMLAHVRAPTSPDKAELRNTQFRRIAELLAADKNDRQILVGDLNTTPWSPYYAQLETDARLFNAASGQGYEATWPSGFGLLKIPIDHCLVSDGLHVRQFGTGAEFGSDHLPIVVDISTVGIDDAELSAD